MNSGLFFHVGQYYHDRRWMARGPCYKLRYANLISARIELYRFSPRDLHCTPPRSTAHIRTVSPAATLHSPLSRLFLTRKWRRTTRLEASRQLFFPTDQTSHAFQSVDIYVFQNFVHSFARTTPKPTNLHLKKTKLASSFRVVVTPSGNSYSSWRIWICREKR